jgi:cellulose synthase/poly-beta-1,6-N-acetylglucosamine synthase-like glycosyltransferase
VLTFLEVLYAVGSVFLSIYGLQSLWLTLLYLAGRKGSSAPPGPEGPASDWPPVTVQLPTYNERYTIERLLEAAARLDYPADRLEIQVLDDSTDVTATIVRALVARYRARGLNVVLVSRKSRSGYKAGALAEGLRTAKGELLAIFDADFVPAPDWLRRTVPMFRDPRMGCVQTRWTHINYRYSPLTQAQALAFDGHFIVEQVARSRNGLFLNFNGSAGIWRRQAIEDAGGWQSDTLTEDMDLSYRAQLQGWRIGYLPDVAVPAELPVQIDAFKAQQFRWAKGGTQTARKLVLRLLKAPIGWRVRLGAVLHLTNYMAFPFMVLTMVLVLPIGLMRGRFPSTLPLSMLAAIGPPLLYAVAETKHLPRLVDRLRVLPLVSLLGFGMSLSMTAAVVQGLLTRGGVFERTPKFNLGEQPRRLVRSVYGASRGGLVWCELALAGYALATIWLLWPTHGWSTMPWMLTYAAGYLFVSLTSFVQEWQRDRRRLAISNPAGTAT